MLISYLYTKRYTDALSGRYLTGINGLSFYDAVQDTGAFYDAGIHEMLFRQLGLIENNEKSDINKIAYTILKLRNDPWFARFLHEIRCFVSGLVSMQKEKKLPISHLIYSNVPQIINPRNNKVSDLSESIWTLSHNLMDISPFKKGYNKVPQLEEKSILLLTATPTELDISRKLALAHGYTYIDKVLSVEEFSYVECTRYDSKKLYIARTHMGSVNAALIIQQKKRIAVVWLEEIPLVQIGI